LLGRNAARRRDEKTRNTAMINALRDLDNLIEKVKNDQLDGESALSQAEEIRKNYLQAMGELKDKKTRNIALKDVSRLDSKISELKAAVSAQKSRQEKMQLLVPTFADGGTVSNFFKGQKHNPLGYQHGSGAGREDDMLGYFPTANRYARYSNSEYILDAETTRNVGVPNLNMMLATKGRSFRKMQERIYKGNPARANGGAIIHTGSSDYENASSGSPVIVEVYVTNQIGADAFVEIAKTVVRNNDGTSEQFTAQAKAIQNEGNNALINQLAKVLKDKLS